MEEFNHKYIVLFSCKDEAGVVQDHPLRPFELEIEANMYLNGYVDAIINHTDETNHDLIKGQFRISKIGDENVNQTKKKSQTFYSNEKPTKKDKKIDKPEIKKGNSIKKTG